MICRLWSIYHHMISDKQLLKTLSCINISNQGKNKMEKNENKPKFKVRLNLYLAVNKKITVAIFYKMIAYFFLSGGHWITRKIAKYYSMLLTCRPSRDISFTISVCIAGKTTQLQHQIRHAAYDIY